MKVKSVLSKAVTAAILLSLSGQTLSATPDPTSTEFLNQWGLRAINVLPAWNSTTGSGIVVASLDTGVNASHFELADKVISVAGGSTVDVDGGGGHGTSIAGVIAAGFNGAGMIGVAYDSRILPIGVADSRRFANSNSATAGINLAASRGDVRIISITYATVFSEPQNSAIINAMNAGKLIVMRAGNDSQANPDVPPSVYNQFNGRGIIVGALGGGNNLISISNKAGAAANVYMVAPGEGIYAPGNGCNDCFTRWTGTSIATPHVAGAAALILSQNPGLSSQEVTEILFNSATDLGAPGVDPVYGHGLLNAAAALSAQGDLDSSSSSSSAALGVGIAALAVGGGIAYFWNKNQKAKESLDKTLVFDSYDRPYIMNLNRALSVQNSAPTLFNVMNMFDRQTRSVGIDMSDKLSLTMHARTNNPTDYVFLKDSDPFLEVDEQVRDEDLAMKMAGNFKNGLSFSMQHNYAPSSGFDKVGDLSLSENFIWSSSYGSQYMGFGNLSDSLSLGYQANNKLAFKLGANRVDDNLENGQSSNAVMLQGSYAPTEKSSVSLRVNNLYENGNLLGGASSGAFSVSNANTTAVGVTGKYKVFDKFSLFASFTGGFTNVSEQQGSFLQSFSGLRSQSWGTGVIGSSLFRYNDRAGFAISSPLRVSNGKADLVVPQSLDGSRNIVSDSTRVSLAPEGSELDFEAFYRMNLSHRTQLGTSVTYRSIAENTSYVGEGMSVFTTIGMRF
ncbi:MAG: S8 family peptidase [Arenicellales bacterium]